MRTTNIPTIKVRPMQGLILIDPIKTFSIYEKKDIEKSSNIRLTKEQIASYNEQIIKSTGDATKVWDEHPDKGIIVAITDADADTYDLCVGDKIAFNHSEYTGILFMYNKKRYYGLRPGEIIARYLTSEV